MDSLFYHPPKSIGREDEVDINNFINTKLNPIYICLVLISAGLEI